MKNYEFKRLVDSQRRERKKKEKNYMDYLKSSDYSRRLKKYWLKYIRENNIIEPINL